MNRLRKVRVLKSEKMYSSMWDKVYLEHTESVLWTHKKEQCLGEKCTIHNLSKHSMRSFPQHFRGDTGVMERICSHGVGHPDPDGPYDSGAWQWVHGCDGCCGGSHE